MGILKSSLGVVVAIALLVPLVNQVFMSWTTSPRAYWLDAVGALLLRSSIVVVGWIAIDVYTALIRQGDRAVLAIWPVDPAQVVFFELIRLATRRLWLVVGVGVLFVPIALIDPFLWGLCMLHTAIIWGFAVIASGAVMLVAVDASDNPQLGPLLDLVRGNNHRAQAAFLYAPGFVLAFTGVLIQVATGGLRMVYQGNLLGWLLLAAPLVCAVIVGLPLPSLARRNWFRAGNVIAEIDARYAILETAEDAQRAYLDWAVRFLPPGMARYALLDLRHGWRQRRSWVSAAWLVGLGAVVLAWTRDPMAPGRTAALAVVGSWILATIAIEMERSEPEFLRVWLPHGGLEKWGGRVFAVALWLQPLVWLGAFATLFRQGIGPFGLVAGIGLSMTVLAASVAVACSRRGGLPLYGPIASLACVLAVGGLLQ